MSWYFSLQALLSVPVIMVIDLLFALELGFMSAKSGVTGLYSSWIFLFVVEEESIRDNFISIFISLEDMTAAMKRYQRSCELKDDKVQQLEKEYVFIYAMQGQERPIRPIMLN